MQSLSNMKLIISRPIGIQVKRVRVVYENVQLDFWEELGRTAPLAVKQLILKKRD